MNRIQILAILVICTLFVPILNVISPNCDTITGQVDQVSVQVVRYADIFLDCSVPLGFAAAVLQASIYDVPGGYRAVMFDRFSGVQDQVQKKKIWESA